MYIKLINKIIINSLKNQKNQLYQNYSFPPTVPTVDIWRPSSTSVWILLPSSCISLSEYLNLSNTGIKNVIPVAFKNEIIPNITAKYKHKGAKFFSIL